MSFTWSNGTGHVNRFDMTTPGHFRYRTQMAWVTFNNSSGSQDIWYANNNGVDSQWVEVGLNASNVLRVNNAAEEVTTITPATSKWYHITLVINLNQWHLYIDGKLASTLRNTSTITGIDCAAIGGVPNGQFSLSWGGKIGVYKCWQRPLSSEEVQREMFCVYPASKHMLLGAWSFHQITAPFGKLGLGSLTLGAGTPVQNDSPYIPTFFIPRRSYKVPGGGAQVVAVGQVTETDTAQTITWAPKRRLVNQVTETDIAQGISKVKVKGVGQVTESDTTQSITRVKSRILTQVTESDTAQGVSKSKVKGVTQVTESDTAQSVGKVKNKSVGQVTEGDLAQSITSKKTKVVGQVTETDIAQIISRNGQTIAVIQVEETDIAQSITQVKSKIVGQVTESDVSQGITHTKTAVVGQIVENDVAQSVTRVKSKVIQQVLEVDSVQSITSTKIKSVGQVTESDTAQSVTRVKSRLIGQVTESNLAQGVNWAPKRRLVEQVSENDIAQSITVVQGGVTVGENTLLPLVRRRRRV